MNESKKHNPVSWEKWRASGAVGTHPDIAAAREREAEAWADSYFIEPTRALPPAILQLVIRKERADHEFRLRAQIAKAGGGNAWLYDTIKRHPSITADEWNDPDAWEKFGDTNNFACMFQETPQELARIIRERPSDFNKYANLIPWAGQGFLGRAIQKVGYENVKRLVDDFHDNPELLGRTMERILPNTPKDLVQKKLHHENTLRALLLALYEEGITISAIVG